MSRGAAMGQAWKSESSFEEQNCILCSQYKHWGRQSCGSDMGDEAGAFGEFVGPSCKAISFVQRGGRYLQANWERERKHLFVCCLYKELFFLCPLTWYLWSQPWHCNSYTNRACCVDVLHPLVPSLPFCVRISSSLQVLHCWFVAVTMQVWSKWSCFTTGSAVPWAPRCDHPWKVGTWNSLCERC